MDATTAVVVLLFVMSILTSSGNKGYSPPLPTGVIYREVSAVEPAASYFLTADPPSHIALENYILKYRSGPEVPLITDSILRCAQNYDVNPRIVAALIARESRFNPQAVSSSGAVGLGQLLPSTARGLNVENPYDIEQNVSGTARYLKSLLERFGGKVSFALAAYFEGPNAVERQGGFSSFTKGYVEDILSICQKI